MKLFTNLGPSRYDALVDSGASYSVMDISVYEDLKNALPPDSLQRTKIRLYSAKNDESINVFGEVALKMDLDGSPPVIARFVVAHIGKGKTLLGSETLRHVGSIISYPDNSLYLGAFKMYQVPLRTETNEYVASVQCVAGATVPPESVVVIKARLREVCDSEKPDHRMFTPNLNFSNEGGRDTLIPHCLVNDTGDEVLLSVMNTSSTPSYIPKGDYLGTVNAAIEVDERKLKMGGAEHTCEGTPCPREDTIQGLPDHILDMLRRLPEDLSDEEVSAATQFVREYQDMFVNDIKDLGKTDVAEHHIDTGEHPPIKIPTRRMPFAQRPELEKMVHDMEETGQIEKSTSPWSFPVLLVKKKDGSWRFCVDYRKLNSITKSDAYPLPRLDDTLEAMVDARYFCSLDLLAGFHQVPLAKESREKTAFGSHLGQHQWSVMPMGLKNAPATFQRVMELVLKGLTPHQCLVYLDDIIVFGATFSDTLENMRRVLDRLREANLKLKAKKCFLFQTTLEYLGHVLSYNSLKTSPKLTSAITDFPHPTNLKEVQQFLGLANYYRRFIEHFSQKAAPMIALTRKGVKFEWTRECQKAFNNLKNELVSAPILGKAREVKNKDTDFFLLDTDASAIGIGAVLSQMQDGEEVVIRYGSHLLSQSERNYCTTKRELLAVVTFVKEFKPYLWGQPVIVRTDHSSLRWLKNFKEPEGMIARWIQVLEEYNLLQIKHRSGKDHENADSLSRPPPKCNPGSCKVCPKLEELEKEGEPSPVFSLTADWKARVGDNPMRNLLRFVLPTCNLTMIPAEAGYNIPWDSSLAYVEGIENLDPQLLLPRGPQEDITQEMVDETRQHHFWYMVQLPGWVAEPSSAGPDTFRLLPEQMLLPIEPLSNSSDIHWDEWQEPRYKVKEEKNLGVGAAKEYGSRTERNAGQERIKKESEVTVNGVTYKEVWEEDLTALEQECIVDLATGASSSSHVFQAVASDRMELEPEDPLHPWDPIHEMIESSDGSTSSVSESEEEVGYARPMTTRRNPKKKVIWDPSETPPPKERVKKGVKTKTSAPRRGNKKAREQVRERILEQERQSSSSEENAPEQPEPDGPDQSEEEEVEIPLTRPEGEETTPIAGQRRVRRRSLDTQEEPPAVIQDPTAITDKYDCEQLRMLQEADPAVGCVLKWWEEDRKPERTEISTKSEITKAIVGRWEELCTYEGVLYLKTGDTVSPRRLIAPASIKSMIFRMVHHHKTGGHMGNNKTLGRLKLKFWWPRMKADVKLWIKTCKKCQLSKDDPTRKALLQQDGVGEPMERVAADVLKIPTPSGGYNKILVWCDYFTKWAEAIPIETETSMETCEKILQSCFCVFGTPRQFHSDQGGNFRSIQLKEVLCLFRIDKTQTTPYNPQSDGLVERFNRTLINMLRCLVNEEKDDWMDLLPYIMMAYRASPHASTGISPNRMMFGREVATPLDLQFPANPADNEVTCETEYCEWLREAMRNTHELARKSLKVAANSQRRNFNRGKERTLFQPGDKVKLINTQELVDKLNPRFKGNFEVVEEKDPNTYKIKNLLDNRTQVVHSNNLRKFHGIPLEEPMADSN